MAIHARSIQLLCKLSYTQREVLVAATTPRIAIVLPRLEFDGVTKVHFALADYFLSVGLAVDFVTRTRQPAAGLTLPPGARLVLVGEKGRTHFFTDLLAYLWHTRPTHIISTNDDVSLMVMAARALTRQRYFVLIGVHTSIINSHAIHSPSRRVVNWVTESFVRHGYRHVGAVVAVSRGLISELATSFGCDPNDVHLIHNPVIGADFRARRDAPLAIEWPARGKRPVVGFFGRLEPQKNVELLVRAFAALGVDYEADLLIMGSGSKRDMLGELVDRLGIGQRTHFEPFIDNPFPLMRQCRVAVLSSRYEGYPNVLVEAMACGCQVIATDCPHGPNEILQGGKLGQLVPVDDVAALTRALHRTLSGDVEIDPALLVAAGMAHSVEHSAKAYLRVMGITP